VLVKRVLRIFGPKGDEVTRACEKSIKDDIWTQGDEVTDK